MRENFNWAERILDNERLPLSLRAAFGTGIVITICTIMALCYKIISDFDFNPIVIFGALGVVVWFLIFYKLCQYSDQIKEKDNED